MGMLRWRTRSARYGRLMGGLLYDKRRGEGVGSWIWDVAR